jgi:hypothetical protein
MQINGQFSGKGLKITVDTLLEQFRRKFGSLAKPGDVNFAIEFQFASASPAGSPEAAEQQLNSLLGAVRCFNDEQQYNVQLNLHVVTQAEEELSRDTQRLVEKQLSISSQPQKLVVPGK